MTLQIPQHLASRTIPMSENAKTVLTKRYLRKDQNKQPVETINELFWRVARHVAEPDREYANDVERLAESFYDMLTDFRFVPNSPTFTGSNTPLGQLSACFVLPIEDNMGDQSGGIFDTVRNAVLIQKTGGGNGFSFSRLRPKGATVKSSMGEASGPISFLKAYDACFDAVRQGSTRRGANMAVLVCTHPDIFDFIRCKDKEGDIANFNISVGVTDAFIQAVKSDADWNLEFDGTIYQTIKARDLFDEIVKHAHKNGEPGVLFLDAANRANPVPHLYEIEATNP